MRYQVSVSEDALELASQCKQWLVDKILNHQRESDRPFSLALAGGSTPKRLYQMLADDFASDGIDWNRVLLLWGDERNVDSDHPDSNYRMVRQVLLDKGFVPEAQVLAIADPGGDPFAAADQYEQLLRQRLPLSHGDFPEIDCILLGLGEDVHTASLFPETDALDELRRWVVANYVPKLGVWRITLTVPLINAARSVVFLVAGTSKTPALQHLWRGPWEGHRFPAQLVAGAGGTARVFVDRDALGSLTPP
jgi:6-phosphogluconolactonase